MVILCGDIGATKSLIGLAERHEGTFRLGFVRCYENRAWLSFALLLDDFLAAAATAAGVPVELTIAGFGVAGLQGPAGVRMTNLAWEKICSVTLQTLLGGAPVCLLNHLEASAHGLGELGADDMLTLQPGDADITWPQLLISVGARLEVAFRLPGRNGARVWAGEGGHVGFAPRDARQGELWRHLQGRYGRVSAEHVVSGPGLGRIHDWLAGPADAQQSSGDEVWSRARRGDARAREALALFVDAFGAVSGDHALSALARGGVYLTGDIAPHVLPAARASFLAAFRDKGAHSALAASMPVHLVTDARLAMLGAARVAWLRAGGHQVSLPASGTFSARGRGATIPDDA